MFLRFFDNDGEMEYIVNVDNIEYIREMPQDCTYVYLKSGESIETHWDLNKIQIALENSNNRVVYDLLYEDKYTGKRKNERKQSQDSRAQRNGRAP